MLTLHTCSPDYKNLAPDLKGDALPQRVVWIDLLQATPDEIAYVERATKRHLPTPEELSEIESSSRVHAEDGVLTLSTPVVSHIRDGMPEMSSLGLILTKDCLITVRFAELTSFKSFAEDFSKAPEHPTSMGAFVGLMDAIVDRAADVLENVGSELDSVSRRVFSREDVAATRKTPPAKADASLRATLRRIGYNGDLSSKIRDSLLGIGRIVNFVSKMGDKWAPPELLTRLEAVKQDIVSLSDYEGHLSNKVQLLLDATMGFINIEQNNIIKVLTIVSVVGVPPTLVAGIYGMNFHNMPEYNWAYGYQFGWAMIILSAIAPLLWFKWRGWM